MSVTANTEPSEEMSNMFASVWVKVEVASDDETPSSSKGDTLGDKSVMGTDQGEIHAAAKAGTSHTKLNKQTKLLYCDHCNYSGPTKSQLRSHLITHNAIKPFKCDQCDYTSKYQSSIQRHMNMRHQVHGNSKIYSCDMCDYKSEYSGNVYLHKRKHSKEKKFKCDKCDYKTSYRNNFDKHANTHKEKVIYKCDKCGMETQFLGRLQRHLAHIHNEAIRNKHACEKCEFSHKEKWKLTKHLKNSETNRVISCEFCPFKTNFKCEFRKHKQIHTLKQCGHEIGVGLDRKDCEQCQAEAQAKMHLRNHLKQAHNVEQTFYSCDRCDYKSTENWRLNIHKQKSLFDTQNTCSHCEFTSNYRCEMKKHKYTLHFSEIYGNGRLMDCSALKDQVKEMINMQSDEGSNLESINAVEIEGDSEDGKNVLNNRTNVSNESVNLEQNVAESLNWFNNFDEAAANEINSEMANLTNEMHKPKKVKSAKAVTNEFNHCQSNNYIIDSKCVAWQTIPVIETDDSEKPFRCKLCDYNSRFKASVQRHYQRHHMGEMNRPYKCLNCDFSTKTKDQIALHNKRSVSTVDLMCESCDFITTFKCSLIYHQKSHYKFKCNICSYSCKLKYDLTKHFATFHLGNGLKCQYCDFTAIRKNSILSHEFIHTGQKPYKCKMCNYTSVRKYLLDLHVRRHHNSNSIQNVNVDEAQSSWVGDQSTLDVV